MRGVGLLRVLASVLFAVWASAMASMADTLSAGAGTAVKRDVLAVYDGDEEKAPDQTRIHKYLEMPLNHLGYRITYWDLKRGTPPGDLTLRHAAVVSWFSGKVPNPDSYIDWAAWAARVNVRFVLFGAIGAEGGADEAAKINKFFNVLGLEFISNYVSATGASRLVAKDPSMAGFERKLPLPLPGYLVVRAKGAMSEALLSVDDPALKPYGPEPTLLVSTSKAGGYVAANYAVDYDAKTNRLSWTIDPIAFLSRALDSGTGPIADTTTRAGRRMYLSHIDGDGWNNTSDQTTPPGGPAPVAAETVFKELIAPYPDLPVTIGLISCDIDPTLGGKAAASDLARQFYALPQVEVASHTHTHPYDWQFFEKYTRARELDRLKPPPAVVSAPRVAKSDVGPASILDIFSSKPALPAPKATPQHPQPGPVLPPARYRSDKPFSLESEVAGALKVASDLAPAGKRASLYLWSGNTRPFEAAVRATRQAGVRNMNGGDTRYDSDFASLAYVRPLSRQVGRERQIFSPNANEMIYTNDWKGPYDGFNKLRETFERTETPRRLRPVNLYYHMFAADQKAGLAAVRSHLDWARTQRLMPVAASQYAAIADDFFVVEFERLGKSSWRVNKRGELQTVRFDAAEGAVPDYTASAGVLGHNRHNGALYVALDPGVASPVIALKTAKAASRAHLVESRWDVRNLTVGDCSLGFRVQGFGRGDMRWAGLKPGAWTIKVSREGEAVAVTRATVDAGGVLATELTADVLGGGMVEMACAG